MNFCLLKNDLGYVSHSQGFLSLYVSFCLGNVCQSVLIRGREAKQGFVLDCLIFALDLTSNLAIVG